MNGIASEAGFQTERYRSLLYLASGGMGSVHLGQAQGELGFSRPVAIKVLHSHLAEDADVVRRFLAEARVASRIRHPNVVAVLDVALDDGKPFLVLDYVHGASLRQLLLDAERTGERAPVAVIAALGFDVLSGLHAAHEAVDESGARLDLVHRDVSPHNILVDVNGLAYVTDFGVAKVKDHLRVTQSGLVGKAGYLAPEQLAGQGVSRVTDLYAAGVVLWEALTGQALFGSLEAQLYAYTERVPVKAPSELRPDVPPELDALVLDMLAREPTARPATALVAAERLGQAVPRAPRSVVGEWVIAHAQAQLDRVDAALRSGVVPPADPSAGALETAFGTTTVPDFRDAIAADARSRRRRRWLALGAGAAAAVVALVFVLAAVSANRRAPLVAFAGAAVSSVSIAAPAATDSGGAEADDREPAPGASGDAGSVDVAASSASGNRPAKRAPAVVKPRAACDPPYILENGVKRYNRDCFPHR